MFLSDAVNDIPTLLWYVLTRWVSNLLKFDLQVPPCTCIMQLFTFHSNWKTQRFGVGWFTSCILQGVMLQEVMLKGVIVQWVMLQGVMLQGVILQWVMFVFSWVPELWWCQTIRSLYQRDWEVRQHTPTQGRFCRLCVLFALHFLFLTVWWLQPRPLACKVYTGFFGICVVWLTLDSWLLFIVLVL